MTTRRTLLRGLGAGLGTLALSGCDALHGNAAFREFLRSGEQLNQSAQRLLMARNALAREFTLAERSPVFRGNGTTMPSSPDYQRLLEGGWADWLLTVDGHVDRPLALDLAQLRRLPARTQITRHDCVEGWSAIGQWTGARLAPILQAAGVRADARYVVFHCMDRYNGRMYYESVDLIDAFHPQTILAYELNGEALPVKNGAPLRLRVERHLGYKHAKYLHRIELRPSLEGVHGGRGGYWEDVAGYEWYAGI